jgi:hypothetical protein
MAMAITTVDLVDQRGDKWKVRRAMVKNPLLELGVITTDPPADHAKAEPRMAAA